MRCSPGAARLPGGPCQGLASDPEGNGKPVNAGQEVIVSGLLFLKEDHLRGVRRVDRHGSRG